MTVGSWESLVVAFKVSKGIHLKLLQLKANFVTDTKVKNINFVKEPASRKPFFSSKLEHRTVRNGAAWRNSFQGIWQTVGYKLLQNTALILLIDINDYCSRSISRIITLHSLCRKEPTCKISTSNWHIHEKHGTMFIGSVKLNYCLHRFLFTSRTD